MMPSSSRSSNGGYSSTSLSVERLVVLVDIKAWQCHLTLPVEESVRRICEACVRDCPSCVWAFKLFDSSLFPLRSASRVKSVVGAFATNVRFDPVRSDPTLARFRSALKCLSLSENTPKPSQQDAGKDSKNKSEKDEGGRADYVTRCLHELLTDYTWEPLLRPDNPSSPDDFSNENPSSNLVVLFSSLPHRRSAFYRFICPDKPQNPHISDQELCSNFILRFKSIEESFKSKNIHLSWIDFPSFPSPLSSSLPEKSDSDFSIIPQIFEQTSLTSLRLDTFLIASEVAPLHLIWTTLAYSPFLPLKHRKTTSLTLRISIEGRKKEKLKHSLCKIDLIPFTTHSLNESPMDKAELCALLRKDSISKMGPLKKAFLCHAKANKRNPHVNSSRKRENDKPIISENVDTDPIGDHVFQLLKQRCSEFTPGKPAWQLLMLYLSREKSIGVVDIYSQGGSKFLALLEPLTVHSAVLRIVEDIPSVSELLRSIGCVKHSSSSSSSSLVVCDETKGSDSPSKKHSNSVVVPKLVESFDELKHEKDSHVSTNCNNLDKKRPPSQLLHSDLFGGKGGEEVTHIKTRSKRVKSIEEQGWEALWENVMSRLSRNEAAALATLKISKLEDLYLKRRDCSKHLKILSCWMKQNRQKLRLFHSSTSNTVDFSSQETSCTAGASQTLANEEAVQDLDETVGGGGVNSCSVLSLDEKQTVEEEHFRETPDSVLVSIDAKMSECLLSPEIDLNNFARRIVSDAYNSLLSLHRQKLMLSETLDGALIGSPELNMKLILVNNLIELFLQKPKKLEVKYRKRWPLPMTNEPMISNSNRGEYLYTSEQKVREYELQIVLRLELLLVVGPSAEVEQIKDVLVKEICSLLENIQFNLPGGIFEGESLLDFSNKIIKTRYKDCLSDIVNEIYEKMELNGHDEEDIDSHEIVGKEPSQIVEVDGEEVAMDCGLSESSMHISCGGVGGTEISDHISSPSKVTPSMEEDSIPVPMASSISTYRPSEIAELSPDRRRRYEEAQAKRERAMQFSHFASRAKALLRVRVIKPSGKGVKKRSKMQSKVPKSRSRLVSNEVVQETPLASSKYQGRCPTREAEQEDELLQVPPISHCRASLYSRLV